MTSVDGQLLSGVFHVRDPAVRGQCRVSLSAGGLQVDGEPAVTSRQQQPPSRLFIAAADIVGCRCSAEDKASQGASDIYHRPGEAQFVVLAYRGRSGGGDVLHLTRLLLVCSRHELVADNLRHVQCWRDHVLCVARNLLPAASYTNKESASDILSNVKPMLVLINPRSGRGRARQMFSKQVAPLLDDAGVIYDVIVTSHAGHARQLIFDAPLLSRWSALLVVSGDGLLSEVYNGCLRRADWQHCLATLPVGIIPAGSGNGLAASLAAHCSLSSSYTRNPVLVSSLAAVKQNSDKMDLMLLETAEQEMVGFLSLGWGLLADIDIESERLRALGSARFTLWALLCLLRKRIYHGTVHFLPATADTCGATNASSGSTDSGQAGLSGNRTADSRLNLCPPLNQPVPDSWHSISGGFFQVYGSVTSHIAVDLPLNPAAGLDDGCLYLHVLRAGLSRFQLLQYLLASGRGCYAHLSFVEVYRVKAVRIVPDTSPTSRDPGHVTVDGELLPYAAVQAEVHGSLGRVLTAGALAQCVDK